MREDACNTMLKQPTMEKLYALHLRAMADAWEAQQRSPDTMSIPFGRIAESVTGAYLLTIGGLDLAHFPARAAEPEVDFVITIGTRRIPVEVKYRKQIHGMMDTEGLRSLSSAAITMLRSESSSPKTIRRLRWIRASSLFRCRVCS